MTSTIMRVSQALRVGLALLLIVAIALNCANIFARYFFSVSYLPSDELQVFAMIVIAFLGTIAISAERQHLRMDVFVQAASPRVKRVLALSEAVVTAFFAGLMALASIAFTQRIYTMDQRSGMADLPMWLPHGTVTLCFTAVALLALLRVPGILRGKENAA